MNTPILIQTAVQKPPSGIFTAPRGRPAIIAVDGIEFSSAIPEHSGEAIQINEIARRICTP